MGKLNQSPAQRHEKVRFERLILGRPAPVGRPNHPRE